MQFCQFEVAVQVEASGRPAKNVTGRYWDEDDDDDDEEEEEEEEGEGEEEEER